MTDTGKVRVSRAWAAVTGGWRPIGIALALGGALALRVTFLGISLVHIPPSSDESISALQAIGLAQDTHSELGLAKQHPPGWRGRFPLLFMAQPYLFPLDAYLMAPFMPFLPRTAVGTRAAAWAMGLASVALSLALLRRWGTWRDVWPGALLILFPSAYLLFMQSAYALPGYPPFLMLSPLALILSLRRSERTWAAGAWSAAAGLFAGLACSVTLLAVPLLAAAGLLCLGNRPRHAVLAAAAFAAGAWVGLQPHFVAKALYPGAYAAVSAPLSWRAAAERLWEPALRFTVPVAMGVRPSYWCDNESTLLLVPGADAVFSVLWPAMMSGALVWAGRRALRRWRDDRRPSVALEDVFPAMAVLSVALFVLSRRSHAHTYRYLLLAVWAFPFVLAWLYAQAGRRGRWVWGGLAVALALNNLGASAAIMARWTRPGFAADEAMLYDLKPVIDHLKARGITRCYASWHAAYRLTYSTDETIVCAQYFNERFFDWPAPYKRMVDAATNVAYVVTPRYGRFSLADFERELGLVGLRADKAVCGEFTVYSAFRPVTPCGERKLDPAGLRATVSRGDSAAAARLSDGVYESWWRAPGLQEEGLSATLEWVVPQPVGRVTLYYNGYPHDRAPSLRFFVRTAAGWLPAGPQPVARADDPFNVVNGHPVMGNWSQTVRFPPRLCDAVRIEIAEPDRRRAWTVGEVEVYAEDAGRADVSSPGAPSAPGLRVPGPGP